MAKDPHLESQPNPYTVEGEARMFGLGTVVVVGLAVLAFG
jgi:hypothetical protein